MKTRRTDLPGVLVIEPDVFRDERGFFQETYRADRYRKEGIAAQFVQDNISRSQKGILRGLHLQNPNRQAKLVYVLDGEVFDVAVDVRPESPTFRQWHGEVLSAENSKQFYVPEGFAHGFCVLSDSALLVYKCSAAYSPGDEVTVRWNDPAIGIDWPVSDPLLSPKDASAPLLDEINPLRLP